MDFAARCVLGGASSGLSETGETLACLARVRDGDPASFLAEFVALGHRLAAAADDAVRRGRLTSAHESALRAANYLFAGSWWAPATDDPARADALWHDHRAAWDLAVRCWPGPAEPVRVPTRDGGLPGYWFSPAAGSGGTGTRTGPAVVLVQGLGTPVSDTCMTGLRAALRRGYRALVVDGPGQGAALVHDGRVLGPSPRDWLADVVDWLTERPDVDPARVALVASSHGSLAAAAHAARDTRIAALVLDPAVTDLGADAAAAVAAAGDDPRARALLRGTTTAPTGTDTPEQALGVLSAHRLTAAEASGIRCPVVVARHESAGGFAGQADALLAVLGERPAAQVQVVRFSAADGAGEDCGIGGTLPVQAALFDRLDASVGRGSP